MLPITDGENFSFTLTFSDDTSTDTFAKEDFIIEPSGLIMITTVDFSGKTATITATTDTDALVAEQTGILTISVGTEYEDLSGNSPDISRKLYEIDIKLPTVEDAISEPIEETEAANDYIITYTFSESIEGITASNFEITTGTGTIADDITHDRDNNTVMLTVTSTEESIEITVKDFTDAVGNKGLDTEPLILNDIAVSQVNSTIGNDDITISDENFIFTLTFTKEIEAATLSVDDFTTNDNIKIVSIAPTTGTTTDFIVEFSINATEDTAAVDFTIAADTVGNNEQFNSKDIVISIDRGPRVIGVDGGLFFNKEQLEPNSQFSYKLFFSEAIKENSLIVGDFNITPSGISAQNVSFNGDKTEATVDFQVDVEIDATTFSITLANDSYTDQADNENIEITGANAVFPIDITVDTKAPEITSPPSGTPVPFPLTINFSEALQLTAVLDKNVPILTSADIISINATFSDVIIDNGGAGGTGRVIIEANITDPAGVRPTLTIDESKYSDTLGNTGSGTYELTISIPNQETAWLGAGVCENFRFDDGDGSAGHPYQISNTCQLQNIAADDITADDVEYTGLLGKNYILMADLDVNYTSNWNDGAGFSPIGDDIASFDGTFDGGDFRISNLTIDRTTDYIGVFGYNTGTIKNIALDAADITGYENVGGLVGQNDGTIVNGVANGSVSGSGTHQQVGGLIGFNSSSGSIDTSVFFGDVVGNDSVGGLVGQNDGTIENSLSSGSVTANNNFGGFVGNNDSGTYTGDIWCKPPGSTLTNAVGSGDVTGITTYENCTIVATANDVQNINDNLNWHYIMIDDINLSDNFTPIGNVYTPFTGTFDGRGFTISNLTVELDVVTTDSLGLFGYNTGTIKDITLDNVSVGGIVAGDGVNKDNIGGLAGQNDGTIDNISLYGSVGGNEYIGGLVGINNSNGIITNSSFSGNTEGTVFIGGFVGQNDGMIDTGISSGSVGGSSDTIGGFVGINNSTGIINNSISSTSITKGSYPIGGFVGHNNGGIIGGPSTYCQQEENSWRWQLLVLKIMATL